VDDGSTDDTKKKISFINDRRLKYFYQHPSGLPAVARNRGIERAAGSYIALLDGDDRWLPGKLQRVSEVFLKHPEVDIVCHDSKVMAAGGKFIRRIHNGPYPADMYGKLLW